MKCVTNGNEVKRIKNGEAERMVAGGRWRYCPKSTYKAYLKNGGKVLVGGDKVRQRKESEVAVRKALGMVS